MEKAIAPITKEGEIINESIRLNYNHRRRLEMQRRIGILSHKRGYLERELRAINNALNTLRKQLDNDANFKKSSI